MRRSTMGDGVLIADGRTDGYVIGFGAGSNDNGHRHGNHDIVEHCGASGDQESRRRDRCPQGIRRSRIGRHAIRRKHTRRHAIRRHAIRRNHIPGRDTCRGNPIRRRGTCRDNVGRDDGTRRAGPGDRCCYDAAPSGASRRRLPHRRHRGLPCGWRVL